MKKIKRVKRKIKFKNILILFSFLLIMGTIIYFVLNKEINNIYIYGNNILSEQDILELMDYYDYKKFYQIKTYNLEKRVKINPLIKSVDIKKSLFSLKIKIQEYDVLWYQDYDGKVLLSNLESIYLENRVLGVPILINQVNDEYLDKLKEEVLTIDKDIYSKISEISYMPSEVDKERFLLYMNDQNYVYINLSRFSFLNKYNETLPKLEGKKGILYLDSGNHFEIKK